MIAFSFASGLTSALGVLLACAGLFMLHLLRMAWITRRDSEMLGRVLELLALATRREQPLPPILERAASELRGRQRRWLTRIVEWSSAGQQLSQALGAARRPRVAPSLVRVIEAAEGTAALPDVLAELIRNRDASRGLQFRLGLSANYLLLLGFGLVFMQCICDSMSGYARTILGVDPVSLQAWVVGFCIVSFVLWRGAMRPADGSGGWLPRALRAALRRVPFLAPVLGWLAAGRVLQLCSSLLRAGVPLPDALRRAGASEDGMTSRGLRRSAEALDAGEPPDVAWQRSGLPAAVVARLRVVSGLSAYRLADGCGELARHCLARGVRDATRLRNTLVPFGVAAAAVLVGVQFAQLFDWLQISRESAMGQMPW